MALNDVSPHGPNLVAIGAKRTCRERRERVDLTKMTLTGLERPAFAAMHGPDLLYLTSNPWVGVRPMRRRDFFTLLGGAPAATHRGLIIMFAARHKLPADLVGAPLIRVARDV